jgi:aflatoxin B1 aldehyde reductase
MTFGPVASAGARITSQDEFNKCLDYFQHQGYNEVDTARIYNDGKQEAFTAQANWEKRGLKIATKSFPVKPLDHEPEKIRKHLTTSLEQLKCDKVDIFYLHAPDRAVPFEWTLKAVDELYREGKFDKLGLSNYAAFEVAEIVMICREHGWVRRPYPAQRRI